MSHVLRVGVADQIAYFRAYNTDGSANTGLTASTTGLSLSVFRVGAANVSIASLSNKAADNAAHADGAIRAVGGNLYTVDLPDAACAVQCPSICVRGSYTGGVIEGLEHPIVAYDPSVVAVGANTTTPPTAAANATAVESQLADEFNTVNTNLAAVGLAVVDRPTLAQIEGSSILAKEATVSSRSSQTSVDGKPTLAQIEASTVIAKEATLTPIASNVTTLVNRITTSVAAMFGDLITMITGGGTANARWTASAMINSPSGDVTVIAAPIAAEDVERVKSSTIRAFTGETGRVNVTIFDNNRVPVVLTGRTLRFKFTNGEKQLVHTIESADITISGTTASFNKHPAITGSPGELEWSCRDVGLGDEVIGQGKMYVAFAP